eukprot:TRINITY_DN46916_c0_g1_i1.p2 TRINITY_DN46916_c0_g1~~TRINITY_DN46916_c0_g1_i1.p2  ORF type:complete len:366 (+),score=80.89 TRINITY_DN46916_c0_g1_i1:65-1162(+)
MPHTPPALAGAPPGESDIAAALTSLRLQVEWMRREQGELRELVEKVVVGSRGACDDGAQQALRRALDCQLAAAADSQPADRLRVSTGAAHSHCAGEYVRVRGRAVNGAPLWANADASRWLYFTPHGLWAFTYTAADFATGAGFIASGESGRPTPQQVDTWQCDGGDAGWAVDHAVSVVALPPPAAPNGAAAEEPQAAASAPRRQSGGPGSGQPAPPRAAAAPAGAEERAAAAAAPPSAARRDSAPGRVQQAECRTGGASKRLEPPPPVEPPPLLRQPDGQPGEPPQPPPFEWVDAEFGAGRAPMPARQQPAPPSPPAWRAPHPYSGASPRQPRGLSPSQQMLLFSPQWARIMSSGSPQPCSDGSR